MTRDSADPELPQNFLEENRPRHLHLEAIQSLLGAPQEASGKSFLDYSSAFESVADTTKTRPTNLLDLYAQDIREIYLDSQNRPEHYNEHQHEVIARLLFGDGRVKDIDKNDLFLTFIRKSVPKEERDRRIQEYERARRQKKESKEEEIVLEDGTVLDQAPHGVFEKQDFGDKIIV